MRLVKFQHTIFAMPFALMAFAYAMWKYALAEICPVPLWWCVPLVQVVLCMVFARNTAMGFNRWADRRIDAANPRTAGREIPAGVISPRRALTFVAVNALLFMACAGAVALDRARRCLHRPDGAFRLGAVRAGAARADVVRGIRHHLCLAGR